MDCGYGVFAAGGHQAVVALAGDVTRPEDSRDHYFKVCRSGESADPNENKNLPSFAPDWESFGTWGNRGPTI